MADAIARLWLGGVAVDWAGVWAHEQRMRCPLPTYPFQRKRHWVDPPGPLVAAAGAAVAADAPDAPDAPEPAVADDAAPAAPGVPAMSPAHETIRRIWVEMLGIPDVGEHDNFFELGGHSLLGTKIVARIRDALGVDLPASALFEFPTIADLTSTVEQAIAASVDEPGEDDGISPELLAEILAMTPAELEEQLARERGSDDPRGKEITA
jgi:acyl transferase domain-containing protein